MRPKKHKTVNRRGVPDANRHAKSLVYFAVEGSFLDADSQICALSIFDIDYRRQILRTTSACNIIDLRLRGTDAHDPSPRPLAIGAHRLVV